MVSPKEKYTFEIIKSKNEIVEDSGIVQQLDSYNNHVEYVYEQENIISKEHSYPSNYIIECMSFPEDTAIDETEEEKYCSSNDEIIDNIEEVIDNEEEIPTNQSTCNESSDDENILSKSITEEDSEVDAFFKTLAMKVKNANLSLSSFTDLQIELLQTIQQKLKKS